MGPVLVLVLVPAVGLFGAGPAPETTAPEPEPAPASESPPAPEDAPPPADGLPSAGSSPAPSDPFAAAGSSGGPYQPRPRPQPAPGGFGSVGTTTTSSALAQSSPPPQPDSGKTATLEISTRAEAGYGQYDLGNRDGLDHHGASLRFNFAVFFGFDKSARVGYGMGLGYGYQGFGRKVDAAAEPKSRGHQQQFHFTFDTIFRPHPQLFSIQISPLVGVAFFGFTDNDSLLIENRPAWIDGTERALVLGGTMGLCTAWDIVCVVGGADIARNVDSYPVDDMSFFASYAITSFWGWHLALGIDVMRIFQRGDRMNIPY